MSILKFEHRTPKTLVEMYQYMIDESKTSPEAVFGMGTNPFYAVEEMELVQRIYHMTERLSHAYIQVIFAFDAGIQLEFSLLKEICRKIGYVLILGERQAVGAIHYKEKDKEHIHCHYLIHYVDIYGKIYRQKFSVYYYMKCVNEILNHCGLTPVACNDFRRSLAS